MLYTQLRSFHAVAREGGFTAASRALNVGQPTITTQVKALEEYYAVELFYRRGRQVAMTEAGRGLYAITQRLMSLEADARDYMNALGGFHTGQLKVGAVSPYHVTEMLGAFNDRFPGVKLSVSLGNSREIMARLHNFEVDVGLVTEGGKLLDEDPEFLVFPYYSHEIVVFVDKGHRLAKRKSIGIRELEGERMVLREEGSTTRRLFDKALATHDTNIKAVVEIGSREAVWMAVQHGLGIGVVSDIEFIPHPNLRMVRIKDADLRTEDYLICLAERRESRIIRAFLDVVQDLRKQNPHREPL